MSEQRGFITNVFIGDAGTEITADVLTGVADLPMLNIYPFREDGGQVEINGVVLDYLSTDIDSRTMTLLGGLPADVAAGDMAYVYPRGSTKWAMVDLEDDDEGGRVIVPFGMVDKLDDGIRDFDAREACIVDAGEGMLVRLDDEIPIADGSYIDPTTLPPNPTDGLPPPSVGIVTASGGINVMYVSWDAVVNADLVTYDVYIGTVSGSVYAPANLVGSTDGTVFSKDLAAGTYFVQVVARDADGEAAPSAEVGDDVVAPVDTVALQAQIDANAAAVKERQRVVFAATQPTGLTADDRVTWYDTSNGYAASYWDGTVWGPYQLGTGAIGANAVTSSLLAANAVTTAAIAANAVTTAQIVADAVTAAQIAASAVGSGELATGAVIAGKITAGTIVAGDIATGAIVAGKIAADAVTATEIAASSVGASEIVANSITASQIASLAITTAELAADSVVSAKIAASTIVAGDVAADTLTASQIAASAITTTELASGAVTAVKVAAGTITANEIAAGTITANEIATGAITAVKIAAGAVTATTIAAGAIDGKTIKSSATGGDYVMLDAANNRIAYYDNSILTGYIASGLDASSGRYYMSLKSGSYSIGINGTSGVGIKGPLSTDSGMTITGGVDVSGGSTFYNWCNINGTCTIGQAFTASGTATIGSGIVVNNSGSGAGLQDKTYVGGGSTGATINNNGRVIRTSTIKMKEAIEEMTEAEAKSILGAKEYTGRYKQGEYDEFADPRRYPFFLAEQAANEGAELWVARQHDVEFDEYGEITRIKRNKQGDPYAFRTAEVTVAHNWLIKDLYRELEKMSERVRELEEAR